MGNGDEAWRGDGRSGLGRGAGVRPDGLWSRRDRRRREDERNQGRDSGRPHDHDRASLAEFLRRSSGTPILLPRARRERGPSEKEGRPGRVERSGYGCVLEDEPELASRDLEAEAKNVVREPAPGFDSDCQQNQPTRPRAFRYSGGSHDARTLVVRRGGCKNRDVGVGWNSACCP